MEVCENYHGSREAASLAANDCADRQACVGDGGQSRWNGEGAASPVTSGMGICLRVQESRVPSLTGELPHATGRLSPRATATEPAVQGITAKARASRHPRAAARGHHSEELVHGS